MKIRAKILWQTFLYGVVLKSKNKIRCSKRNYTVSSANHSFLENKTENDMSTDDDGYILGIDIGTTSVKVCVFNTKTSEIVGQQSKDTQSQVPSDQGIGGSKQDVPKIISALNTCVAKFPKDVLQQVSKIGVCGQMHGVLFWNNTPDEKAWERIERDDGSLVRYDITASQTSALYTWQDNRCDPAFLASLPTPDCHLPTCTGYGTATIFWMSKFKPDKIKKYNCSGTIQDLVVAILCNLEKPVMSHQNAASWGYFNCATGEWNLDILSNADFPTHLLPTIKKSGHVAGYLEDNWHCIAKGTPVGVALGDLQCSVLSTIESKYDAVLNISTSAQIAVVKDDHVPESGPPKHEPVIHVPYFETQFLAVAASLNGGNALATFVKMVQKWSMDLGFSVPQSKIWEKLIALSSEDDAVSELVIKPTCYGERHAPDVTASVTNINIGNLDLGKVFRALCRGLIQNLHSMMPKDVLNDCKIERIVGNGSGLSRNKVLQKEVQLQYELPLVFTKGGDAAKGAAMAMHLFSKQVN